MSYNVGNLLTMLLKVTSQMNRHVVMSCYKLNDEYSIVKTITGLDSRCLMFGNKLRVIATSNRIYIEGEDDRYTAVWALLCTALYETSAELGITIKRVFNDTEHQIQHRDCVLNQFGLIKLNIPDRDYLFFEWIVE